MRFLFSFLFVAVTALSSSCAGHSSKKAQSALDAMKAGRSELQAAKIEWLNTSNSEAQLVSYFQDAKITTYFKQTSRSNFFHDAIPLKQEFVYLATGQVFTSLDWESRLWDDGVSGYSFRYKEVPLTIGGTEFESIFVTINDRFADKPFQARYTLHAKIK